MINEAMRKQTLIATSEGKVWHLIPRFKRTVTGRNLQENKECPAICLYSEFNITQT